MYKWLALMDEHGSEILYLPNYHRQRIPYPVNQDWIGVEFGVLGNQKEVTIAGCWICDSETSRMRDGEWLPFEQVVQPRTRLIWHLRGERDVDA